MKLYSSQDLRNQTLLPDIDLCTTKAVPVQVQVYPARRWWCFGQRGWRVRLSLASEQRTTWRWSGFAPSLQEVCAQLGISEAEQAWSIVDRHLSPEEQQQAGWTPFMML